MKNIIFAVVIASLFLCSCSSRKRANETYSRKDPATTIQHSYGGNNSKKSKSYSSTAKSTSGKTVQVKGYYRKNGTYVKPHTRSAPKRRK
jgi:hypothetical protein